MAADPAVKISKPDDKAKKAKVKFLEGKSLPCCRGNPADTVRAADSAAARAEFSAVSPPPPADFAAASLGKNCKKNRGNCVFPVDG